MPLWVLGGIVVWVYEICGGGLGRDLRLVLGS